MRKKKYLVKWRGLSYRDCTWESAVDIDDDAVSVTLENAAKNNEGLVAFNARNRIQTKCDLLLANILANPLIVLAPLIASMVSRGGKILLSGILFYQKDKVMTAFSHWFSFAAVERKEDWILIEGTRN